jgi:hypothetical protein
MQSYEKSPEQGNKKNEKRAKLIELSDKAREFRKQKIEEYEKKGNILEAIFWTSKCVNDIIAGWYRETTGATTFKTFAQWKSEGYNVKKGERAHLLWSHKQNVTKETEEGEEKYQFFPMAYLFSDLQVVKQNEQEAEQKTQAEECQQNEIILN